LRAKLPPYPVAYTARSWFILNDRTTSVVCIDTGVDSVGVGLVSIACDRIRDGRVAGHQSERGSRAGKERRQNGGQQDEAPIIAAVHE
jgi:hypothetical protein